MSTPELDLTPGALPGLLAVLTPPAAFDPATHHAATLHYLTLLKLHPSLVDAGTLAAVLPRLLGAPRHSPTLLTCALALFPPPSTPEVALVTGAVSALATALEGCEFERFWAMRGAPAPPVPAGLAGAGGAAVDADARAFAAQVMAGTFGRIAVAQAARLLGTDAAGAAAVAAEHGWRTEGDEFVIETRLMMPRQKAGRAGGEDKVNAILAAAQLA
jgi:hypothetical protein